MCIRDSVRRLVRNWDNFSIATQQSRWPACDPARDVDGPYGQPELAFYEEPVDSSVLFADAPFPRARAFREAMRIHDDSGAVEGLQTRDAGTVAMPATPIHAERGDDAPYDYFIHATRLDEAASPVARGYLASDTFLAEMSFDNFLVWPEAVPFHRATSPAAS